MAFYFLLTFFMIMVLYKCKEDKERVVNMNTHQIIEDLQKQNELLREENHKLISKLIKMDYELQMAKLKEWGASDKTVEDVEDKWIEEHKELLERLD